MQREGLFDSAVWHRPICRIKHYTDVFERRSDMFARGKVSFHFIKAINNNHNTKKKKEMLQRDSFAQSVLMLLKLQVIFHGGGAL